MTALGKRAMKDTHLAHLFRHLCEWVTRSLCMQPCTAEMAGEVITNFERRDGDDGDRYLALQPGGDKGAWDAEAERLKAFGRTSTRLRLGPGDAEIVVPDAMDAVRKDLPQFTFDASLDSFFLWRLVDAWKRWVDSFRPNPPRPNPPTEELVRRILG